MRSGKVGGLCGVWRTTLLVKGAPTLSIDCVTSLLKDDSTSLTHGRGEERGGGRRLLLLLTERRREADAAEENDAPPRQSD